MRPVLFCIFVLSITCSSLSAEQVVPLWPQGHKALEGLDKGNTPSLTIHLPEKDVKKVPVILLVCPGGAYAKLSMNVEGHSVAKWYAKQGLIGVTLKYRLPKRGKWSPKREYSTLRDAQRAVKVMRSRSEALGIKDAKIGILGFSAGAHLACMTATRCGEADAGSEDEVERVSSRPDFACLIYPVISMMEHGHNGSRDNLLGPDNTEDDRKEYSGEYNVTKDTPPIFLAHANNDGIKVENSIIFYLALKKQKHNIEMHIVSRGRHGFFNGKGWGIPQNPEVRFTRSGGQWPIWTLNWMLEEKLVTDPDWIWIRRQAEVKQAVDP